MRSSSCRTASLRRMRRVWTSRRCILIADLKCSWTICLRQRFVSSRLSRSARGTNVCAPGCHSARGLGPAGRWQASRLYGREADCCSLACATTTPDPRSTCQAPVRRHRLGNRSAGSPAPTDGAAASPNYGESVHAWHRQVGDKGVHHLIAPPAAPKPRSPLAAAVTWYPASCRYCVMISRIRPSSSTSKIRPDASDLSGDQLAAWVGQAPKRLRRVRRQPQRDDRRAFARTAFDAHAAAGLLRERLAPSPVPGRCRRRPAWW